MPQDKRLWQLRHPELRGCLVLVVLFAGMATGMAAGAALGFWAWRLDVLRAQPTLDGQVLGGAVVGLPLGVLMGFTLATRVFPR